MASAAVITAGALEPLGRNHLLARQRLPRGGRTVGASTVTGPRRLWTRLAPSGLPSVPLPRLSCASERKFLARPVQGRLEPQGRF